MLFIFVWLQLKKARVCNPEEGQSLIEYALLVALIVIVALAAAKLLGAHTSSVLHKAAKKIGKA